MMEKGAALETTIFTIFSQPENRTGQKTSVNRYRLGMGKTFIINFYREPVIGPSSTVLLIGKNKW